MGNTSLHQPAPRILYFVWKLAQHRLQYITIGFFLFKCLFECTGFLLCAMCIHITIRARMKRRTFIFECPLQLWKELRFSDDSSCWIVLGIFDWTTFETILFLSGNGRMKFWLMWIRQLCIECDDVWTIGVDSGQWLLILYERHTPYACVCVYHRRGRLHLGCGFQFEIGQRTTDMKEMNKSCYLFKFSS